jgi:RNA polymerase primary sigma factor
MNNNGKYDFLTAADAEDMALISLLMEIGSRPLLEPDRERALFEIRDNDAQKEIVDSYMRLVVAVAKAYVGQGRTFMELVEAGKLGLIRAVEKYELDKGYEFSTYATWWIEQAIEK